MFEKQLDDNVDENELDEEADIFGGKTQGLFYILDEELDDYDEDADDVDDDEEGEEGEFGNILEHIGEEENEFDEEEFE